MGKDIKGKEIGEGFTQRKDGRYVARYVDRFGKRICLYNRDLKQLKLDLNEAIYKDQNHISVVNKGTTLNKWFEKWLNIHKEDVIRQSTRQQYISIFEKHISPYLGRKCLSDITQLNIKETIKAVRDGGYGYETQNKVRILLLDMFNKAMIDDYVVKNPAKGVSVKRNEKIDRKVLTQEEQVLFFECCKGTFYDNLFVTAVTTGLRPGELFALTWDDIDLENMEININKTLVYQKFDGDNKKTFHLGPPKTEASNRTVPITRQCEMALKKQYIQHKIIMNKKSAKPIKGLEKCLFTTKYGTPLNPQIYSDAIKVIINEINLFRDELEQLEYFSGHTFRHTFATRCFESNIQGKTIQKYLGHATLQMTMDLYTHVLDDHKKVELKKLEGSLDLIEQSCEKIFEERFAQLFM